MDELLLQEIWEKFAEENIIDERLNPVIAKSWRECRNRGLNPKGEWSLEKQLDSHVFESILEANRELIDVAVPIIENVYQVIDSSQFLLVLTDSVGYVLKVIGEIQNDNRPSSVKLVEGALWDATSVGTNSVSLVLENDMPIQMVGAEHFRPVYHNRSCCGAPIHGRDGEIIGTISFTGPISETHLHSLALTVSIAFSIETMLVHGYDAHLIQVSMEGSGENIVLLDNNFTLLYINTNAKLLLQMSEEEKISFARIIADINWEMVKQCKDGETLTFEHVNIALPKGMLCCNVTISVSVNVGVRAYTLNIKKQEQLIQSANTILGNKALYSFQDIVVENQLMKKTISLAQRYAIYDANVLIEGEFGSGKDLLAQAIHQGSRRANAPFFSINCYSLPRKQLEMELFSSEEGDVENNAEVQVLSRFELANGGTVFIGEIDQLTLEHQKRLLNQILQIEHENSMNNNGQQLDIRIMASASTDLQQACQKGHFLHPLYLKLSTLQLDILPLRQRPEDVEVGARSIIKNLNEKYPNSKKEVSDEYIQALKEYTWPGNQKELETLVERSFYESDRSVLMAKDFAGDNKSVHFNQIKRLEDEKKKILEVLVRQKGVVEKASNELGVSRATFYRMCIKHGIEPKKIKKQQ